MPDIIKRRVELPEDILMRFQSQDVATVHEAMGRRGAMGHEIKPVDRSMRTCGRALTVHCQAGDNLMLIKAVQMAHAGDVIVADMGAIVNNGPFGEVLAVECIRKQVAGLVVSCSVRDSQALIRRGFPVFSAGLSVFGTVKSSKGQINHPVVVGGVVVRPGDLILGDADGVVAIPWEDAAEVLCAADKRCEKESVIMKRLEQGESLFDIYGYQRVFDALGVTEE